MANKIEIVISAVDRASMVAQQVNRKVGAALKPLNNVGKNGIGEWTKAQGLKDVWGGITSVGSAAEQAASKVTSLLGPLAAVSTGAIAAGVIEIARAWGEMSFQLERASQALGISVGGLQEMRGVALAAGLSADDANRALDGLGRTLNDAKWGRNQGALMALNKIGFRAKFTKEGVEDLGAELKELGHAIAAQKNPQTQTYLANTVGLGSMLPLLRRGTAVFDAYMKEVDRLGYVQSKEAVEAGERFQDSINLTKVAIGGLTSQIGEKLVPIFGPTIDRFREWTVANREVISTKIAEFVGTLGDRIFAVGSAVNSVVTTFGGWANWITAIGALITLQLLKPIILLGFEILGLGWKIAAFAVRAAIGEAAFGALGFSAGAVVPVLGAVATEMALLALPFVAAATAAYMLYDALKDIYDRKWVLQKGDAAPREQTTGEAIFGALTKYSPLRLAGDFGEYSPERLRQRFTGGNVVDEPGSPKRGVDASFISKLGFALPNVEPPSAAQGARTERTDGSILSRDTGKKDAAPQPPIEINMFMLPGTKATVTQGGSTYAGTIRNMGFDGTMP